MLLLGRAEVLCLYSIGRVTAIYESVVGAACAAAGRTPMTVRRLHGSCTSIPIADSVVGPNYGGMRTPSPSRHVLAQG